MELQLQKSFQQGKSLFGILLPWVLVISPGRALEEVDWLPKPNETSCFQYDSPPSCDVPVGHDEFVENYLLENNLTDELSMDYQAECAYLDGYYIWWYDVVWEDVRRHVDSMSEIQNETYECEAARQVYHQCYWCIEEEQLPEKYQSGDVPIDEYCLLEHDPCVIPDHVNMSIEEIQDTCDELFFIIVDLYEWPASTDLCNRAEYAIHACDWYCVDGDRNPEFYGEIPTEDSCWTLEDPPDCTAFTSAADSESLLLSSYNNTTIAAECEALSDYMYDDWYLANPHTHAYAFAAISKNSTECEMAQIAYPHCMFCHPLSFGNEDFCSGQNVCDDAGHRKPIVKDKNVNMKAACERLETIIEVEEKWLWTADLCYQAEMSLHACEFWCEAPYLGADTTTKKWTLVWLARSSAFLSFFGALYILYDVLSEPKNRKTVYHQLLLAMAVFDLVTALAWSFSTAPLPEDEAWKIVGAMGNDMTCTAQAFFIQLGFTSVFYNSSLAAYYILVVVYRWREDDLRKIRPYMHLCPLLVGLGLALFIIPHADWTGYGCHILPPPDDLRWKSLVFVVIPLGISVVAITAGMAFMYFVVRKNAQASRKWSFGVGSRNNLETQVFWQSLLYTLSFYITWPIMFAVYLGSVDYKANSFALTATVSFVAPLQGFSNFVVYIRPKLLRILKIKIKGLRSTWSSRPAADSGASRSNFSSTGEESKHFDPSVAIARTRKRFSFLRPRPSVKLRQEEGHPIDTAPPGSSMPEFDDENTESNYDDEMDPSAMIAAREIVMDSSRYTTELLETLPSNISGGALSTHLEDEEEEEEEKDEEGIGEQCDRAADSSRTSSEQDIHSNAKAFAETGGNIESDDNVNDEESDSDDEEGNDTTMQASVPKIETEMANYALDEYHESDRIQPVVSTEATAAGSKALHFL